MSEKRIKLIIIGDSAVGKTCILNRYIKNEYKDIMGPTVGTDIVKKKVSINSQEVLAFIWDTAGQEKFEVITTSFFRNTNCGMIVFDITNLDSFKNVEKWVDLYNDTKSHTFIIVGNKSDLSSERKVSKEEAEDLAQKLNTEYFEVSAKDGSLVNEAFEHILTLSLENFQEIISETVTLDIENDQKSDSKCKC